jgi:hypothetical protein
VILREGVLREESTYGDEDTKKRDGHAFDEGMQKDLKSWHDSKRDEKIPMGSVF